MGIFCAELTFDGAGNVLGIVAQPTGPEFAVSADNFSFRPDGQQVAYESGRKLFLAPDLTGLGAFNGGKWAADPAWSPNGAKIAFHGNTETNGGSYATFSISADNTGLTLLAQGTRARRCSQNSRIQSGVRWSPNGTHLVYTEKEANECSLATLAVRVRRITAAGGDNSELPTVGPTGGAVLGWGAN